MNNQKTVNEVLNPPDAQDDFTEWMRTQACFHGAKRLPDGTYAGVVRLMFTFAICIGVTQDRAYARRYCYDSGPDVLAEYEALTCFESEPRGWVATRPHKEPPVWE